MATSSSTSDLLTFDQAYELMKKNDKTSFDRIYRTLLTRSDYLTVIPPQESYSILHYMAIHGTLELFNKVIGIPNLRFNIQMKSATKPPKDILELASENRKTSKEHRSMYETINRLMNLDRFVEHAKRREIDECIKMLDQDPELANQKPPYRKYFLIHHLAFDNNRAGFDRILKSCDASPLNLSLLTTDNKTASQVAIEENHKDFADYLESLSPEMRQIRENNEKATQKKNQERLEHSNQLETHIVQNGGASLLPTFTCPLTKEIFQDPVVLTDGITYERAAIEKWLADGNKRSPMTNMPLESTTLIPNITVKQALQELSSGKKQ